MTTTKDNYVIEWKSEGDKDLNNAIKGINSALETYVAESKEAAKQDDKAQDNKEKLAKLNDKLAKSTDQAAQATDKLNQYTRDANGRLRDANGRFVKTGESTDKLTSSLGGLGKGFGFNLGQLAKLGPAAMAAGAAMTVLSTGALVAGKNIQWMSQQIAEGVRLYTQFQTAITQAGAATGGPIEDRIKNIAQMSEIAKKASQTSKFSALEAATGLDAFARAGLTVAQQEALLADTLNFATANTIKLDEATKAAVRSRAAFNITAQETPLLLDQITKASTMFLTSVNEIVDATSRSAGSLKLMGNSNEDIIALNSVLIELTGSGELAGTALRGISNRLTEIGSDKAAGQAFKQMGVEIYDASGNVRNLIDIISDLEKSTGHLDGPSKLALYKDAFGAEFAKNVVQLVDKGSKSLRGYSDALQTANGENKKMADLMQGTLSGKLTIIQGKIETLKTEFGEALEPALMAVVGGLGSLADHLTQSPALFNALITASQGWIATASDLVPVGSAGAQVFIWMIEQAAVLGLQIQGLKLDFESLYRDLTTEEQTKLDKLNTEVFRTREEFEELRWKVEHVAEDMEEKLDRSAKAAERFKKTLQIETDEELFSGYNADAFTDEQIAALKASGETFKIQLAEHIEWQKSYAEREAAILEDLPNWEDVKDKSKSKSKGKSNAQKRLEAANKELVVQAKLNALNAEAGALDRMRLDHEARLLEIQTGGGSSSEKELALKQENMKYDEALLKHINKMILEQGRLEAINIRTNALKNDLVGKEAALAEYDAKRAEILSNMSLDPETQKLKLLEAEKDLKEKIADIDKKQAEEEQKRADASIKALKDKRKEIEEGWKKGFEASEGVIGLFEQASNDFVKGEKTKAKIAGALEIAKGIAATADGFATGNPMQFIAAAKHGLAAAAYFKAASASSGASSGGGGGGSSSSSSQTDTRATRAVSEQERMRAEKSNAEAIAKAINQQTANRASGGVMIEINNPVLLSESPQMAKELSSIILPEMRNQLNRGRN